MNMRVGSLVLTMVAAGCQERPLQVGEHPVIVGADAEGIQCPENLDGAFPCIASSAAVGYTYDCCGGPLPTRTCGPKRLECHTPEAGGLGVCIDRNWSVKPKKVCINRTPGDNTCDFKSVLASPTFCMHHTQCGGALYEMTCSGDSCSCDDNGEITGPFPMGDACESDEKAHAAAVRLCKSPAS
jgi:hypothetical protein